MFSKSTANLSLAMFCLKVFMKNKYIWLLCFKPSKGRKSVCINNYIGSVRRFNHLLSFLLFFYLGLNLIFFFSRFMLSRYAPPG